MRLIPALSLFIGFDVVGEWLQRHFALPIPGALIGLVLLTLLLFMRPRFSTENMRGGARLLLLGMSMFFVPAGTGVITQLHAIRIQWLPISAALIVSTLASLLVTAWVMRALDGVFDRWRTPRSCPEPVE